ncbi:hypothetical protein N0V90_001607 [Kalmusia sp. IMI 367209]|nr:hypothetical protein N0V90_001607 [Kalmusia sp. IMI 367209]
MKFTFKPFKSPKSPSAEDNSGEEPQNRHQRRREQVRRAQKTHRERKEAYIKSLETEVIQLRANEARLFQETKRLYTEMSVIKNLLLENNIPIPPGPQISDNINLDDSEETFEFSIRSISTKLKEQRIHVRKQTRRGDEARGPSDAFPCKYCIKSDHHLLELNLSASESDTTSPALEAGIIYNQEDKAVSQLDPTAIGMDFILSLEAPCLGHIPTREDHQASSTPSGHALMASATLLHHHHPSTSDKYSNSSPTWRVHESGVERLLALSSSIPLDGEMTPVQAWDQIRRHPQYETLEWARLERLKAALLAHVKCYGFGGVIPQDVFENALFDTFVVGRVF